MRARLHRVELLVEEKDIEAVVSRFNDVLGFDLSPPDPVPGQPVRSAYDEAAGLEVISPHGEGSPLEASLETRGRGAIGPIVWEVDDIQELRDLIGEKGLTVRYEYVYPDGRVQISLHPDEFFGYTVTFMEAGGKGSGNR